MTREAVSIFNMFDFWFVTSICYFYLVFVVRIDFRADALVGISRLNFLFLCDQYQYFLLVKYDPCGCLYLNMFDCWFVDLLSGIFGSRRDYVDAMVFTSSKLRKDWTVTNRTTAGDERKKRRSKQQNWSIYLSLGPIVRSLRWVYDDLNYLAAIS